MKTLNANNQEVTIDLTFTRSQLETKQALIRLGYSEQQVNRAFQLEDKDTIAEMMKKLAISDYRSLASSKIFRSKILNKNT